MKAEYMEMLVAIGKAIEKRQADWGWRIKFGLDLPDSVPGYCIKLEKSNDWFARIDWLEAEGYIKFGSREWCDITDSYWETYSLTELGKETIKRR